MFLVKYANKFLLCATVIILSFCGDILHLWKQTVLNTICWVPIPTGGVAGGWWMDLITCPHSETERQFAINLPNPNLIWF